MLADVIGEDEALRLVASLPRAFSKGHPLGQPILYVPKTLAANHALVVALGYPVALRLVRAFGGEILYPAACAVVSRAERNRAIVAALKTRTDDDVAEMFGLSVRHIRNVKREMPPEDQTEGSAEHSATVDRVAA